MTSGGRAVVEHSRVFRDLSEAEVERLAHILAPLSRKGEAVALSGELGAGKSVFARAFIRTAMGDARCEVPSPTYTLVQRYTPRRPFPEIWHVDLYRVEDNSELAELGLEETFAEGLTLIEWPRRIRARLPGATLEIEFSPGGGEALRTLALTGRGPWAERLKRINIVRT